MKIVSRSLSVVLSETLVSTPAYGGIIGNLRDASATASGLIGVDIRHWPKTAQSKTLVGLVSRENGLDATAMHFTDDEMRDYKAEKRSPPGPSCQELLLTFSHTIRRSTLWYSTIFLWYTMEARFRVRRITLTLF